MSFSINEALSANETDRKSLQAIHSVYPDAYADRNCWVSPSLAREDCDALVEVESVLRFGRMVAGHFVGVASWPSQVEHLGVLLADLKKLEPEAYKALVRVATGVRR